ncbi:MAG: chromosome partitioning protein ParA, partial [Rhodothermales bacterium]|nr:chromosome partitioning protein ParA [Rhodothermales bacterium]
MAEPKERNLLRDRIARARRRMALGQLGQGLLLLVAVACLYWLIATSMEALLRLPGPGRMVLLGGAVLLVAGLVTWQLVLPVLRWMGIMPGLSDDAVATRSGVVFPEVRDRLLNLLELLDGRHSSAPAPLILAAADRLGTELATV